MNDRFEIENFKFAVNSRFANLQILGNIKYIIRYFIENTVCVKHRHVVMILNYINCYELKKIKRLIGFEICNGVDLVDITYFIMLNEIYFRQQIH